LDSSFLDEMTVASMPEVLQLWRQDLIGCLDAPADGFGFGSFQVAASRTRRRCIWRSVPGFACCFEGTKGSMANEKQFGTP
jgi:hypothetical protein